MRDSVEIEIGDVLYEVEVSHFQPAAAFRWNEAPEGGEIDLGPGVKRFGQGDPAGPGTPISYSEFFQRWCDYVGLDVDACRRKLEDKCYELMLVKLEEDTDE